MYHLIIWVLLVLQFAIKVIRFVQNSSKQGLYSFVSGDDDGSDDL